MNSVILAAGSIGGWIFAIIIIVILVLIISCVKVVPQTQAFVIERLGGYKCTWSVGLHF